MIDSLQTIKVIGGSTYLMRRNWTEVALEGFQYYAGQTTLLCPSWAEDSWMASLLNSFYAPLLPPQELVQVLDQPAMKNFAELVKKTVTLQHQQLESYIVCKLPCVLTEVLQGTLKSTTKRTRCCFTPHYRMNQVPFKVPPLIGIPFCYQLDGRCFDPELVTKINQPWKNKHTAMQSITVAILNHLLEFKTYTLNAPIVFAHCNYICTNDQGVMYSQMTEQDDLLDLYEKELACGLVWIMKKGSPKHPAIHFMSDSLESEYLNWVQIRHERLWEIEHQMDPVFIV
jgi:hypothetical protein